jgi:hypothetical protein
MQIITTCHHSLGILSHLLHSITGQAGILAVILPAEEWMMVDSTNRSRDPSYAIENFPPIEKITQSKAQPSTTATVCHGMLAGFREGIDAWSTEVARPSAKGSNLHFGGPAPSGPGGPAAKQTPPTQLSSAVAQLKGGCFCSQRSSRVCSEHTQINLRAGP